MKKIVFLFITLLFTLTLASCKKGKEINLSYDEKQIEVFVGDEVNVKPNVEVGKKVKSYELEYTLSSDIATVKDGILLAKEAGTVELTVVANNKDKSSTTLTIVIKEKEVVKKEYTITFNLDGGVQDVTEIKFKEDENVTLPTPTKEGYKFLGWYEEDVKVENITNKNYTLVAKWEKEIVEYNIIYIAPGAKMPDNITTKFTDGSTVELPVPTKKGYVFKGWYEEDVLVETLENRDYTLTATWEKEDDGKYEIKYMYMERADWYVRTITKREEVVEEFYNDLYKWAKLNGETATFEDYKATISEKIKNYEDIKLIDPTLKDGENTKGGTEYFLNTSQFYGKWINFFDKLRDAVLKKNSSEDIYYDVTAFMTRLYQYLVWNSMGHQYFRSYSASLCKSIIFKADVRYEYEEGQTYELVPLVHELDLDFYGWYDNPEFEGEPVTAILPTDKGDKVFYAKWEEEIMPTEVVLNKITELLRYESHQLTWPFTPTNTTNQQVEFISSNKNVAKVDSETGLITAISEGTTTITMRVLADNSLTQTFELEVYEPGHIQASYDTTSYVAINDVIKLNATLVGKGVSSIVWESEDESIAMVDQEGNVSGLKEGLVTIIAKDKENEEIYFEFIVTVVNQEVSDELQLLLDSHNANIFTEYELGIGSGTPTYYKDIFGSSSKLLMNNKLTINDKYHKTATDSGKDSGKKTTTEFVTVHYTGNMSSGADAEANANYFSTALDYQASIHYCTGNDGVFYCTDESLAAWHAGDSGSISEVGHFKWMDTGLEVLEDDPIYPLFTISDDFYYEINGRKTSIEMAKPWNYKSRNTDYTLNADGTLSSKPGFTSPFKNRLPETFINDQGLPFKVENGKYYMGTTWWCYSQVYEGRICSTGGNYNSVGIESCVNQGSDLWLTWQITAQLVADIMVRYNLDITRVRGHHFYTAKDCPQPMLENNLEIWWEFLELVEAEHKLMTQFKGYTVTAVSNDTDYLRDNGRVRKEPETDTCVSYTITITNGDTTETITLGSILPGKYSR